MFGIFSETYNVGFILYSIYTIVHGKLFISKIIVLSNHMNLHNSVPQVGRIDLIPSLKFDSVKFLTTLSTICCVSKNYKIS